MIVLSLSVAYMEQLSSSGKLRQRIISRRLFSLCWKLFSTVLEHTGAHSRKKLGT